MNKVILIILMVCYCGIAHTQDYSLTTYQDDYIELEDYESLQLTNLGDVFAPGVFELDFSFPYFDLSYDELTLSPVPAVFSFPDQIDFSIRLLSFMYDWDNLMSLEDIPSDIRYKLVTVDGVKAFAIQYTRMRFASDPSIEEFDSYLGFQYWFFEDGTIEFKMGPSNLDNSPVYVPGEGFLFLTAQGPINLAVEIALYHPFDIDRRYWVEDLDSYSEYVLSNERSSIDWLPPAGWTYRFTNLLVSSDDLQANSDISIYPNPATNLVSISTNAAVTQWQIIDMQGVEQMSGSGTRDMDVSDLAAGMYMLVVETQQGTVKEKLIKI